MPVFQRKRSILFLISMLALLIGVIAISFFLVSQQAEIEGRVKTALEAQLHLSRVFSLLQDAETGQRGYLLTGKASYLDPYNSAVDGNSRRNRRARQDARRQRRGRASRWKRWRRARGTSSAKCTERSTLRRAATWRGRLRWLRLAAAKPRWIASAMRSNR